MTISGEPLRGATSRRRTCNAQMKFTTSPRIRMRADGVRSARNAGVEQLQHIHRAACRRDRNGRNRAGSDQSSGGKRRSRR